MGRPFGSRREVDRAAFQAGSCSCKSEAVVKGDIARKGWRDGIEAVVVVKRLSAAPEEVVSVGAGRNQDCMVEEDHRRVDRAAYSVVAEQAAVVACSAAAQGRAWVAWAQAQAHWALDCSSPVLTSETVFDVSTWLYSVWL